MSPNDLLAVRGLRVGHAENPERTTGVTVVLFDHGAPTIVDVRGGASGTYNTSSLSLEATFGARWALFLAGGSLYGLDAARGTRTWLLENGRGFPVFGHDRPVVPISGAVIFDLPGTTGPLPDFTVLGYAAAEAAGRRRLDQGRVGAGRGATVAKYLGRRFAAVGGLGSASRRLGGGHSVGVLTVVNAAGGVRDPENGRWVAVARGVGGRTVPPPMAARRRLAGRGTTLTVVATDLALGRPALARVASIVHAGVGRAVVPYQTAADGDLVFAATTSASLPDRREGWPGASADRVGRLAADAAVEAVLAAVRPGKRPGER